MSLDNASHVTGIINNQESINRNVSTIAGGLATIQLTLNDLAKHILYIAKDPDGLMDSVYVEQQSEKVRDLFRTTRSIKNHIDAIRDCVDYETEQEKLDAIAVLEADPYFTDYTDVYPDLV